MTSRSATPSHSSPVYQFLQRLPTAVSKRIIGDDSDLYLRRRNLVTEADELLRILKAKNAVLPKDNQLVRAGLVVDFLCRHARNDDPNSYRQMSIPVSELSRALNMKGKKGKQTVEQMQEMIGAHLEASYKKKQTQTKKRSIDAVAQNSSTARTQSQKKVSLSADLVKDLCIRLGPMISSPNLTAAYAQKIFDAMANYSSRSLSKGGNSKKHEMVASDISRNQEYYEAACFFLAVQKIEGGYSQSKSKVSSKKAQKKKDTKSLSTNTASDAEDDDEDTDMDEDRPLNEMDVIMAASLGEGMFNSVLDCVRSFIDDVEILWEAAPPPAAAAAASTVPDESESGKFSANPMKQQPPADEEESSVDEEYEEWKHELLEEGKEEARQKMRAQRGDPSYDPSDHEIAMFAAENVLRQFNIIP